MKNLPNITILCHVVDNYGDIGVAYRLARALSEQGVKNIRLVVDDLNSFSKLAPGIDKSAAVQTFCGLTVFRWNCDLPSENNFEAENDPNTESNFKTENGAKNAEAAIFFEKYPPEVIIECFACGRPEWLENLIFGKKNTMSVQIINLEYLSAEPYAEEFHKLQSLTRSAKVKKVNFMPGFTDKTGGLILDNSFMSNLSNISVFSENICNIFMKSNSRFLKNTSPADNTCQHMEKLESKGVFHCCESIGEILEIERQAFFPVVVFSYSRDFKNVVESLSLLQKRICANLPCADSQLVAADKQNSNGDKTLIGITVFVAAGLSYEPFISEWKKQGEVFNVIKIPFLPQNEWDTLLCKAAFLFIRGEDSLSRACLSGVPFVWHAYPQSDDYQLVKVRALLQQMESFFHPDDFQNLSSFWLEYNGDKNEKNGNLFELFCNYGRIAKSFASFAEKLKKNGNLALHLMTFISEIV